MKITKERWQEAQIAERLQHTYGLMDGFEHYRNSYKWYFHYLGIDRDEPKEGVLEVGPADFPGLGYCNHIHCCSVVEPMPSEHLKIICNQNGIQIMNVPLEEIIDSKPKWNQIWLLNVMQHIIDPEKFIEVCKKISKRIYFFEPINEGITTYHPHSYKQEDFERWFPGAVNYYNDKIEGFHQAECVYGHYDNIP